MLSEAMHEKNFSLEHSTPTELTLLTYTFVTTSRDFSSLDRKQLFSNCLAKRRTLVASIRKCRKAFRLLLDIGLGEKNKIFPAAGMRRLPSENYTVDTSLPVLATLAAFFFPLRKISDGLFFFYLISFFHLF